MIYMYILYIVYIIYVYYILYIYICVYIHMHPIWIHLDTFEMHPPRP